MDFMPSLGTFIAITIFAGLFIYIGIPMLIIAIVIAAFYFVGAPFYNVLDIIKKIAGTIREKFRDARMFNVFEKYSQDEIDNSNKIM